MKCKYCGEELWIYDSGWTWYSCATMGCENYQKYLKEDEL